MDINLLFLSANWKVSWIKMFKEALASLPNAKGVITAMDKDPLSPALYFCDSFAVSPPHSSEEFLEFLVSFCQKSKIQWIIPSTDRDLIFLDAKKTILKEHGITPLISSSGAINTCHDKWKTYQFFKSHEIDTPETFLPEELMEFPAHLTKMVVKARTGEGSNEVHTVSNSEELRFFTNYLNIPLITQKYIAGTEYSVDVVSDLSENVISAVPRERIYARGGEILKGKTVKNYDIMEKSRFIAEKLGVKGPSTIQCIVSSDGIISFTDVNPRFGSGFPFSIAAGCPIPKLILEILSGQDVGDIWGNFTDQLVMLRYDDALYKDIITK